MKKIIIGIIIFAVLAISTTATMIYYKTKITNKTTSSGDTQQENLLEEKEETINLFSTYDENDIEFYDISVEVDRIEEPIKIKQIKGLKDKNVESKINNMIKEKALTNISNMKQDLSELSFSSSVAGNFGNIISLDSSINYKENDEFKYFGYIDSYELVNGNELKIEDIFSKDTNLEVLLKKFIYKQMARDDKGSYIFGGEHSEPYYDEKQGIWLATYYTYDEGYENRREEVREYIPAFSDYEIEKMTKQLLANKNSYFTIMPNYLHIIVFGDYDVYGQYGNFSTLIQMRDIADNAVIYDKYLTTESIYENDSIGIDNLLKCTNGYDDSYYDNETKFESSNFFYNVENRLIPSTNYPSNKFKNEKENEIKEKINAKIEEYRKISNENKQKAYFLFINAGVEGGGYNTEYFDELKGERQWKYEYNNLFSIEINECVFSCDINNKDLVMKELLAPFYTCYDIYEEVSSETFYSGEIKKSVEKNETKEKRLYDVYTGSEINDAKELFIDSDKMYEKLKESLIGMYYNDIDIYKTIEILSYDTNEIIIKGTSIFNSNSEARSYISYQDLEKYVKVKPLREFMFANSSVTNLTRENLAGLNKTELYRAYNEIFARHGHDFKMKEYQYYFNLWDWYHPIPGKTVSLEELTDVERENVQLIKSVIDEID